MMTPHLPNAALQADVNEGKWGETPVQLLVLSTHITVIGIGRQESFLLERLQ